VTFEPDLARIPALLRETIHEGDMVLTLGAGNMWKVGEELIRLGSTTKPSGRKR
jgi:UDP-N-acetylmuramate-alanine ligase